MGVSSSESHDLTAFYEMLSASFGVLSQNTGFYPSLDRIIETMLGPLNLGPGGGSYNKPISHLHCANGTSGIHTDYHPSLASCATPDPTYHHLPTTFHHQPINFDQLFNFPCMRVHLIYGPIPPLTHHPITISPPHGHPISGPWGCYVHTWNSWGGLCLPSLYWVLLHVSCCSIIINCMR